MGLHECRVRLGKEDKVGFAIITVADGYLARDDVGQGVNEYRGAGVVGLRVADGVLVLGVGDERPYASEEQHGTVGSAEGDTLGGVAGCFGLQQELGSHKAQLAEGIHLVVFGVVGDAGAIEVVEEGGPTVGTVEGLVVEVQRVVGESEGMHGWVCVLLFTS